MTPGQRWTLVATIIGSSLTFIDATAVNVALPSLQTDLGATITDVQWVIEAYALFLGSLILVGGSLGDQFGRKRTFLAGVLVFTLASIACAVARSTGGLIAARALQGVGAAFLVPGSLAILSATFEGAERGRAIGTWSGFGAITTALGPVVGGWLIEHVSWRAVFLLNVPLAALVVALSVRFMDETSDPSRTRDVDWWGAVLAIVGLGGVVFALLEWPARTGGRGLVTAALGAGVGALVALVMVERRARSPMLPLGVFRSRAFSLANVLTLLLYGPLSIGLWLVPLNLIQIQHYSATAAGAALLPLPILIFALSRWAGGQTSIDRRWFLAGAPVIVAAGLGVLSRTGIGGSYWTTFFPGIGALGLGMALVVAPLTTTVMSAVEAQHSGVASGVNNAVARVAGLIAIAVLGIVLVRAFESRVAPALDRVGLSAAARASVDAELPKLAGADLRAITPDSSRSPIRRAIDESFVDGFRLVMIVAAGLALGAAMAGLFVR